MTLDRGSPDGILMRSQSGFGIDWTIVFLSLSTSLDRTRFLGFEFCGRTLNQDVFDALRLHLNRFRGLCQYRTHVLFCNRKIDSLQRTWPEDVAMGKKKLQHFKILFLIESFLVLLARIWHSYCSIIRRCGSVGITLPHGRPVLHHKKVIRCSIGYKDESAAKRQIFGQVINNRNFGGRL
jgi:hypothetical protein